MVKQRAFWVCQECENKQVKWTGSCGACNRWETLVEEQELSPSATRFDSHVSVNKPVLIGDVDHKLCQRVASGYQEFDRLMGGGVVSGSLNLIGGQPGIGKSTFLLQLSKQFADQGLNVLYVCGEESAEQTALRAQRLGVASDRIYLYSETLFSHIRSYVEKMRPDILIIDSVQIVYKGELPSAPGSVAQVKEITMECMHLAKGEGITTFLIGHVTKTGDIAGPRVLEHIVDTVLEFEGDRQHGYRMIRSVKNRFGSTDDIALFQMTDSGLKEIKNPSAAFLEERTTESPGSVVVATIEGTRALLIEVQALVAKSSFATATRRSMGFDQKRLTLLLAVLEKRMGYQLQSLDVFVSIAGGMKILEPAIDLGTILAIASSYCNRAISNHTVIMGEVGLGGEVRSVPRIESRIKEAMNMGFKKCVLSSKNLKGLNHDRFQSIELLGVSRVEEAISLLLGSDNQVF